MPEPKPPPTNDPKREGGVKAPAEPASETQDAGMINEGEPAAPSHDDRPGGMIGEG